MGTTGQSARSKRWLVNSFCDDTAQTFLDCVMAETESEAIEKISAVRTYATADHAQTYEDNLRYAKKLLKETPAQVNREYRRIMKSEGKKFCPKCRVAVIDKEEAKCQKCEEKAKPKSKS